MFVSSTIKECAAERAVVRDAISSTNHEPVLFEDVGARPHPPRDVYKSRLEISHVFIGIYREQYGWVAPGMDISGVEDELRIAAERGIDRLIYVYRTPTARDQKLQDLIDEAKGAGITLGVYEEPAQLRSRVRDDLTAVVSNRFVDQVAISHEAAKPDEIVSALIPNPVHRFRRRVVEDALLDRISTGRVAVTAPLGGGKTILTAQVAAREGWIFVDGRGLSHLDVIARIGNALRQHVGQPAILMTSEYEAVKETLRSWDAVPSVAVVVDGAPNPKGLWNMLSEERRLVITSRSAASIPSTRRLHVPPLTTAEIASWVSELTGRKPDPGDIVRLAAVSGGNPLYLRFFALGAGTSADMTLRELEIGAVQELSPTAREIVSYLALSPRQLRLADLQALLGAGDRPEAVAEQLLAASGIVEQRKGVVGLVHEHLRKTVTEELHEESARFSFFASRLGGFLEKRRDFLAAFYVYREAGEQRHVDRVLGRAGQQAVVMGGGAPAIPILRRQAELARNRGDAEQELRAAVMLAGALRQTGATTEARAALNVARTIADAEADSAGRVWVTEAEAALGLDNRTRRERTAHLEDSRRQCLENGDQFGAARIGTLLTVEYISARDYQRAVVVSRDVVRLFGELGDGYGNRIARLNLASALSGVEGGEEEAAGIVQELDSEVIPEKHPRERALLCNYLARRYREAGDLTEAARFAVEAIQIGEELKDAHVIAINRTILGNVRRDGGDLSDALSEYRAAERASVEGRLQDTEAAANELIASVYNQREEYGVALHHAEYASAVARMAGDHVLVARAEEERAVALEGERRIDAAVEAYAEAIKAIASERRGRSFFVSLVSDALSLCTTSRRSDLKIDLLRGVFLDAGEETRETNDHLRVLYRALPEVADGIKRVEDVLTVVALAMEDALADRSGVVQRRIVMQAADALIPRGEGLRGKGRLVAVAAILMVQVTPRITLDDVADLGERIAASSERLYFRPLSDGAGQWTVRLDVANGVVLSLVQLDAEPRSAILTTVLALLLVGLDGVIGSRLLDVEHVPRQEGIINVASRKEVEAQLGPAVGELGEMASGYRVSESTDIGRSDQPPILVIRAEERPTAWRPSDGDLSDVHVLFGELLRALVHHFLARTVEPEVLFPKIGATIRAMRSRRASGGE